MKAAAKLGPMWDARVSWRSGPSLLGLSLLACSTRLDPTVAVARADAGPEPERATAGDCAPLAGATGQYWVCAFPLASYAEATAVCLALGSELASVSSPEENSLLAAAARERGTLTNLWIGGTRDEEQVWRWPDGSVFWSGLVDGSAPTNIYANWQNGEPNDSSTVTNEHERCAALALFDDGWRDRACSLKLSFFCERPSTAP
jgi:Lectin C-type domain